MKQFIRDYLTFNRRERNGLFILITIIFLMIVYLNTSHFFLKPEVVDFTKFEKEIEQFNASMRAVNDTLKNEKKYRKEGFNQNGIAHKAENSNIERFDFNPNGLPDNDWKRLGLTDNQIRSINNYKAKGGKFRNKEDVKKMYCLPAKQYLLLEPYIQIPSEKKEFSNFETLKPNSKKILVELNSADSAQLISLNGIGAFYAKAIIKYRTMLGGFVDGEQLMEIWKFDSVKFEGIKKMIIVDKVKIKKININTCTSKELKHPYLTWNAVNVICNYRNKHGNYKTIDEIKKTDLVDEITYRKIAPYLIVE